MPTKTQVKRQQFQIYYQGLFGLIVGLICVLAPFQSFSQFDPAWFVKDVDTDLANDPVGHGLIVEFGDMFFEDGANDGDVSLLPSSLNSTRYMGSFNLPYRGQPELTADNDLLVAEEAFYHSSRPEVGVGWRNSTNAIELHWMPDYRFAIGDGDSDAGNPAYSADGYIIYRRLQGGTTWIQVGAVSGNQTTNLAYLDSSVPNDSNTYEYIISTLHDSVEYQYSDPNDPIVVSQGSQLAPHFHIVDFEYYDEMEKGADWSWSITVISENSSDLSDLDLELMHINSSGQQTDILTGTVSGNSKTFGFNYASSEDFKDSGGVVFRLRFDGNDLPYTENTDVSHHQRYLRNTVNNRVMSKGWKSYLLDISTPAALNGRIGIVADQIARGYAGVFVDNITKSLPLYVHFVLPYTYDESSFENSMGNFVENLISSFSSGVTWMLNCSSHTLIKRFHTNGVNISGYYVDNLGFSAPFKPTLARAVWLDHRFPEYQVVHGYKDANFSVGDWSVERSIWISSYMVSKSMGSPGEPESLFGIRDLPNSNRKITLAPEQLLDLGNPLIDLENLFDWTQWDNDDLFTWDELATIDVDEDFVVTVLTGGEPSYFVYREFENGVVIINVQPPSSGQNNASLADILGNNLLLGQPYYRVDLDDVVQVTLGAKISSTYVTTGEDMPWDQAANNAFIFMYENISSPEVAGDAVYALPWGNGLAPILAIEVSTWDGTELESLVVDGGELGWNSEVTLSDPDGDSVYTYVGPEITVSQDFYHLPYVAVGSDGLRQYGEVRVQVTDPPLMTFVNSSSSTGELNSAPPVAAMPYASAAFDYDADEKPDLYVSYGNADGFLFNNLGPVFGIPNFADRTVFDFSQGSEPSQGQKGVAITQFGTDAMQDFFVAHPSTPQLFLRDDPAVDYENMAGSVFSSLPLDSYDAAWMDYDKDGLVDLAVARSNQPEDVAKSGGLGFGEPSWLYHHEVNNGVHSLELVWDTSIFPQVNHYSYEVVWRNVDGKDANNEEWMDLFICDLLPQQSSSLMINEGPDANGVVTFKDETTAWFPADALPKGVRSAVFADFDNDGDDDLATCSWGQDDNLTIYINTGSEFIVGDKEAMSIPVEALSPNGLASEDFDGNNLPDLLVQPYYDELEPYVLLNGVTGVAGVFSRFDSLGLGLSRVNGTAIADWGNDGDPDLYLGRTRGSGSFYYNNELVQGASAVPYVKVKLRGGGGENGAGIGSTVEILDSGYEARKVLWSKNGRNVQPLELIFPLDGFTGSTVNVRVTWPSGHTQDQTCTLNSLTTILDDSYLIDGSTVTSDYNPSPTGTDWVFEWVTTGPTPASEDYVTITGTTDVNSPCYCDGVITLDENYGNVDITIEQESGGWRHTLVWHDGCCVVRKPACVYNFDVGSGNTNGSDSSINHTFKTMRVCGSGF